LKILTVDLTKKKIKVETLKKEITKKFIGGLGVGAYILFKELKAKIGPLSPENMIIFASGPITGIRLSGSSRITAVFKSPQTGIFASSNCGGFFGPELRKANFDVIAIKGRAETPVYLLIEDGRVEILDAGHLWGLDTFETEEILKKEHGSKFQVVCIGPAGEKLVKFACICHDRGRQFGRAGSGAVMGSKNLKAIVIRGESEIPVADEEELDVFREEIASEIDEKLKSLKTYGTPGIMTLTNKLGALPTKYWRSGQFEGAEEIGPKSVKEKVIKSSKACLYCRVACGKISIINEGLYVGVKVEGPEYETLYALGSLCGNSNLHSIIVANELCDRYGVDTITTGNVIAFAMELYEKGILKKKETEGLELNFGNHKALIEAIKLIGLREGVFGELFSGGVLEAASKIGDIALKLAVHVKGLEPAGYEPRALYGMGLGYATSYRGACHLRSVAYRPNLVGVVDRFSTENQAKLVKESEDFYAFCDSLVLCRFLSLPIIGPILQDRAAKLYQIVVGENLGVKELMETGERIINLIRMFNIREGVSRKDDILPRKFTEEPLKGGPTDGKVIKKEELDRMLDEYYMLRGWNANGVPTEEKLSQLKLKEI